MYWVKAAFCAGIPPIVLDGNFGYLYHISSFSFSHFRVKLPGFNAKTVIKTVKKLTGNGEN